ncbi:MAG: hypothetical protein KatS3mg032_1314 [Cyclobacteriaceae bacterium]|nr:MAG: hypothetical protein KatS3mg032_1314 [Cyclobacteriaceae bacterium]
MNTTVLVQRARTSALWRWVLNRALHRFIPFNRPHRFTIEALGDDFVQVRLPFRKNNLNHIRGLHACALATLAEYTTGFMLVQKLNARQYRLIMKKLEMEYHYQGKSDAVARFGITHHWLQEKVMEPLRHREAVEVVCEVTLHDAQHNHLATGKVCWHIKPWQAVKTKV